MKKTALMTFALAMASVPALAGGLLTNTNQNAAYIRNMAQEGQITLTSIYANPAGGAFLSNGWHLSLNSQSAFQQRNIETTFPYFQQNMDNHEATHRFEGRAKAPVIPSFTVSYNQDKWSVSAHFGLIGGGGKCEFKDGLGSFESLYSSTIASQLPGMVNGMVQTNVANQLAMGLQGAGVPAAQAGPLANQLAAVGTYNSQMTGYSMDAYMRGRSYYFGLQLGATYKFAENVSGYVGVRGVYATCNYNGYVQDVKAGYAYSYSVPTQAYIGADLNGADNGVQDLSDHTLTMNTDQSGFGITPIIGVDWMINDKWNVGAKFEAPTKMNLKNTTSMNQFAAAQAAQPGNVLGKFKDGSSIREDIPGILAFGVEYSPIKKVRLDAAFHEYFDKSAKKYNDEHKLLDHNTWELLAGVEWDCCKLITVSASWQKTVYGLSDANMNDLSFNLNSNMVGFGVRIHPSKYFNIDLGYMHTIYGDRDVASFGGLKNDRYVRKNDTFGIGFNFAL